MHARMPPREPQAFPIGGIGRHFRRRKFRLVRSFLACVVYDCVVATAPVMLVVDTFLRHSLFFWFWYSSRRAFDAGTHGDV